MRQQQIQQQQVQRQAREFDSSRFQRGERAPQQVTEQQRTQRSYRGYRGGYGGAQPQQVEQAQRSGSWSRDRGSWSQNCDGDFRQRSGDQQHIATAAGGRAAAGTATGATIAAMIGAAIATVTGRPSTSASTLTRSAVRIGRSASVIACRTYFGQRYWIDPGMYQLPYPPPGTQWVRYWNDAVLVDTYSGEVVDVIRDFFW